jgi:hypothetical protein
MVPPQHSICSRLRSNPVGFEYCAFLRPAPVGVVKAVELQPQQITRIFTPCGPSVPVRFSALRHEIGAFRDKSGIHQTDIHFIASDPLDAANYDPQICVDFGVVINNT